VVVSRDKVQIQTLSEYA